MPKKPKSKKPAESGPCNCPACRANRRAFQQMEQEMVENMLKANGWKCCPAQTPEERIAPARPGERRLCPPFTCEPHEKQGYCDECRAVVFFDPLMDATVKKTCFKCAMSQDVVLSA